MAIGNMMEEGFKNLRRELHAGSERHTNLSDSVYGHEKREEELGTILCAGDAMKLDI